MNHKLTPRAKGGYTLIELMLVIAILSLIVSIILPHYDLVLIKAYQAKAKGNLGTVRTAVGLYYSDLDGHYPLAEYGEGVDHLVDDMTFSTVLSPKWVDYVPMPLLKDRAGQFNGLDPGDWDVYVKEFFAREPPEDVHIYLGPAGAFPGFESPYVYDNKLGIVYIPNGNFDTNGRYFYDW